MSDTAADQVPAPDVPPDAVGIADAIGTERALPEIEHAIGPLRQAVLDHLIDSVDAGPQSVAQIIAALPAGTTRGNVEAAILREYRSGRIERVSPGHYVLAAPQPPAPPDPPPPAAVKMIAAIASFAPPIDLAGLTEAQWFDALEAWHADPATWDANKFGPLPDQPGHKVPLPILSLFRDRIRKRQERQREAEAAADRQAAADRELRDQLIAATGGNFVRSSRLDDVSCIRAALETVPINASSMRSGAGATSKSSLPMSLPCRGARNASCARSPTSSAGSRWRPRWPRLGPVSKLRQGRPPVRPTPRPVSAHPGRCTSGHPGAPGGLPDADARASIIAAFNRPRAPQPAPTPMVRQRPCRA